MSALAIYDSMRRNKVEFVPIKEGEVSIYLCGPTTYASAHIGHAYSAICFDMIRRSLTWLGYKVTFVRNITDVDDKIINKANELGEEPLALAARFADAYNRDMELLGVMPPDIEPRVSDTMDEIIALIGRLIENGYAYVVDGDVYYSVEKFAPYGKLSGQSLEALRAGERVEIDPRKQSPADFALWKAAKPGEPSWKTPWGEGRPGWHIECSAMTRTHLGETFDLHGGGKDLIFPHHENEIAQSQADSGEGTFSRWWLHNGFLNFSGEKMSKSLGNVFGCQEIAASVGPEAMKFFTVSHHYRSPVNFDVAVDDNKTVHFRDLEAADRRLDYFYTTLRRLDDYLAGVQLNNGENDGEFVPGVEALVPTATSGIHDDFNAPVVIAALSEAAKLANRLLDEPKSAPKWVRKRSLAKLANDIRYVASALGILASEPIEFLNQRRARLAARRGIDTSRIDRMLESRAAARAAKDYAASDAIRDELTAMGIEVLDTSSGVDWRIIELS